MAHHGTGVSLAPYITAPSLANEGIIFKGLIHELHRGGVNVLLLGDCFNGNV